MAVFGFLFQRFTLGPELSGLTYVDFLVPGICAMTVLFGASQAGIALVRDIQTGYLQRMVRAAVRPGWMLAGKLVGDVTRLLAQAAVVAVVGTLVGATLGPGLISVGVAALGLTAFAVGYASLSCWIAIKTKAPESMGVFVHLVNMPILFTSTALVPVRQMPGWLQTIAARNPLTLVANDLRGALLFDSIPDAATSVGPLVIVAGVFFLVARSATLAVSEEGGS
jgi:ABC-2 type transport system permease protein